MPDREGYYPCLVRLPYSTTTEEVWNLFSQFGRVLDAMVFMDNFTGESLGEAYVIFENRSARSAAVKMVSGRYYCRELVIVDDSQYAYGRNAYECHDDEFDEYFSIGESRERGPPEGHSGDGSSRYVGCGSGGPGPDRGMKRPREGNTDAGSRKGSAERLRPNVRP